MCWDGSEGMRPGEESDASGGCVEAEEGIDELVGGDGGVFGVEGDDGAFAGVVVEVFDFVESCADGDDGVGPNLELELGWELCVESERHACYQSSVFMIGICSLLMEYLLFVLEAFIV